MKKFITFIQAIGAMLLFSVLVAYAASCSVNTSVPSESNPKGVEIHDFQVVDVNGDTITIHMSSNGGVPSSAYKKVSK